MVMSPRSNHRHRKIAVRCAALLAAGLLAAACGTARAPSAGSGGSATAGTAGTAGTAAAARISLDVDFSGSPTTPPAHYSLRCEPAGGSLANPAAACAKLLKDSAIFGPLPAHMLCPMVMASAGRATVTGIYLGRRVHESIIDGGCDLARWAKLRQVFGT
jgi:hypothetical protein